MAIIFMCSEHSEKLLSLVKQKLLNNKKKLFKKLSTHENDCHRLKNILSTCISKHLKKIYECFHEKF